MNFDTREVWKVRRFRPVESCSRIRRPVKFPCESPWYSGNYVTSITYVQTRYNLGRSAQRFNVSRLSRRSRYIKYEDGWTTRDFSKFRALLISRNESFERLCARRWSHRLDANRLFLCGYRRWDANLAWRDILSFFFFSLSLSLSLLPFCFFSRGCTSTSSHRRLRI